ncbi:MAG TPA: nitronate monooxygenase family protein [Dehalococcoidia bacterium]|nr:nitronate monooxygenase family protein [Dehalococcoidia bacterium]
MARPTLRTPICDILGIEYPVVLAGMGGVARHRLVAAISDAGGLGIIGAATMGPDELREEIGKVRELTDKPFGVDILLPTMGTIPQTPGTSIGGPTEGEGDIPKNWRDMLPATQREFAADLRRKFDLPDEHPEYPTPSGRLEGAVFGPGFTRSQIDTILEEKVPVFASGLGNPGPYVEEFHAAGVKVIALVGNVKNARRVADGGTDVVVAQGAEAGGHTGRVGTMALVPQVVDAVAPTPVLAAGGIGDGRGLAAALCLGAVGAWVGTAFLVAKEAAWDDILKQRILDATEEDTRVTRIYSGKPMRNINNPLIEAWEESGVPTLPFPFQGAVIQEVTFAAQKGGRKELGMNPAGQVSGMLNEQRPAKQILQEMVEQATEIIQRLPVNLPAVTS